MTDEINMENKTPINSEEINQRLSQLFGEDIANGFERTSCRMPIPRSSCRFTVLQFELCIVVSVLFHYLTTDKEINCPLAIADLLQRDADSAIFVKLRLTYGKALRFKRV